MGYLDKQDIYIKGLPLKFIENSRTFAQSTPEQKQTYFSQYEALKKKFYKDVKTTADTSDNIVEDNEDFKLLKHRVLSNSNANLTNRQRKRLLKKVAEAELSKKDSVMALFTKPSPDPLIQTKTPDSKTCSILSVESIEGMSASASSGKIAAIKDSSTQAVENHSPIEKKTKENSLDEDAFEYILSTLQNIHKPYDSTTLDQSIIGTQQDLNVPDDTRKNESFDVDSASYIPPNTDKYVKAMWTRYNTNDEAFNRLYSIPYRYTILHEIEEAKDLVINAFRSHHVIQKMLGVMEKYCQEAESTLKLSVGSSVYFLKDWNIVKNQRVM